MAETLPLDEFAIDARVKGAICGTFATARAGCETLFMLGSIRMKKIAFVVAAAGLMTLAACNSNPRSEEHTSELQSLMRISYAVFCLKKKKNQITTINTPTHTTYNTINLKPTTS